MLIPNLDREIEMLELKNGLSGDELFIGEKLLSLAQEGIVLDDKIIGEDGMTELERLAKKLQIKKDLLDATKLEVAWANKLNGAMMQGIMNNARFAEAFGDMLTQMLAEMISKAAVFTFLNILTSGGFGGGWTGLGADVGGDLFHQGGEVQGYATGGMIPMQGYAAGGGVDNIPIMAQEGEFMMRRSAVESIGLENMNRMNQTGQASGGVNVNFSGNVLSKRFIEKKQSH